jgi:hypothetical protein
MEHKKKKKNIINKVFTDNQASILSHARPKFQSGQYILNAVICQLKALKAKGVAGLPDPLAQIMVKD